MTVSSRFIALAIFAACGGTPQTLTVPPPPPPAAAGVHTPDPDLQPKPSTKLLSINWETTPLATNADATAVWKQIALTGDDYELKLGEIPAAPGRVLARAMLRGGNFVCLPPPTSQACAPLVAEIADPKPTSTLDDPCLRRIVAMWALDQIEAEDLPGLEVELTSLAALPPPESELVSSMFSALPETAQDLRLALMGVAKAAGQREIVNGEVSRLDPRHVMSAARDLHIDGAFDILAAQDHRDLFLAAIVDEQLAWTTRLAAIDELASRGDKLAPDLAAVLIKAVSTKDCQVAAGAARTLEVFGDKRFVPRPRARGARGAAMMRSLCVLASYERLLTNDEPSRLAAFLPAKGLQLETVTYDELGDVDADGDGDPHTNHQLILIPRNEAVLPELDDLIRAFRNCAGTTCASLDRDFKFTFKPANLLARIDVVDRPPCPVSPSP